MKTKVQDECDYDEAAVDEEKKDASDDEAEPALNLDDENPDEVDSSEDEPIKGVEAEFQQQYKVDKEKHLWCELSFQVN